MFNYLSFQLQFCTFCDMAEPYQTFVQDPATPTMEGMIYFHNLLMFYMLFVGIFVFYMLFYAMYAFLAKRNPHSAQFSHNSLLEIIWTILPAIILLFIAIPSFTLLYSLDEFIDPELTVKIIGHQWYWTYEISDPVFSETPYGPIAFDSFMFPTETLDFSDYKILSGKPRLLMSQPLVLPINTHIRLLVTSADVLHSWAVPSFGIKIDACPGRLAQGSLFITREGVCFGQCSEICGINHGFMPIQVSSVKREVFAIMMIWVANKISPWEVLNVLHPSQGSD